MADSFDEKALSTYISSPATGCTVEDLAQIARSSLVSLRFLRERILKHPLCGLGVLRTIVQTRTLNPEILQSLVADDRTDYSLLCDIAHNRTANAAVLAEAAACAERIASVEEKGYVHMNIADNPKVTSELLLQIIAAPNPDLGFKEIILLTIACNPSANAMILQQVIVNPQCVDTVLLAIVKSDAVIPCLLQQATEHPACTDDIVDAMVDLPVSFARRQGQEAQAYNFLCFFRHTQAQGADARNPRARELMQKSDTEEHREVIRNADRAFATPLVFACWAKNCSRRLISSFSCWEFELDALPFLPGACLPIMTSFKPQF